MRLAFLRCAVKVVFVFTICFILQNFLLIVLCGSVSLHHIGLHTSTKHD